jgi:hypothetical protein
MNASHGEHFYECQLIMQFMRGIEIFVPALDGSP